MSRLKTLSQIFFNSVTLSFTRAIWLNPNAIRKKRKKLARNRLQTYSTLDGFAIAMDGRSDGLYVRLRCNASCITERRARRSISLLRGIHSTREIAPPRTKRDDPRRFYYTALKPGRLPLQSYRSKLAAPLHNVDHSKNSALSLWH